jgi:acyl-coenzyme A thioesterase PaaI-like protein
MAFAAHARLEMQDQAFATASLTVHFLRPAPAPARYLARGRILKSGSRLLYAEADIRRESEARIIAAASAVMALADP